MITLICNVTQISNYYGKKFILKKGEIAFGETQITINDNSRKDIRNRYFLSITWVFYGLTSLYKYSTTGDEFMLWSGMLISISHLGLFIHTLLRSNDEKIALKDVKSIKLQERFGNIFIVIKLNNGKFRLVNNIEDITEIESYLPFYHYKNI